MQGTSNRSWFATCTPKELAIFRYFRVSVSGAFFDFSTLVDSFLPIVCRSKDFTCVWQTAVAQSVAFEFAVW